MRFTCFAAAMTFAGAGLVSCAALAWDQDPAAQYLQRSNKITLSAGNAKEVNAATHVIDPWPPYVGNRRIPGNGARLAGDGTDKNPGVVKRYESGNKLPPPPPMINIFPNVK